MINTNCTINTNYTRPRLNTLSVPALKSRGWTEGLIRDLLGEPDEFRVNPHYRSGPPMRLYSLTRVEGAEHSDAWASCIAKVQKRKESSARAVKTKRNALLARLETAVIKVPIIDLYALTGLACEHYNEHQDEIGRYERGDASPASDPDFLARISVNYLRHALSEYDGELLKIFGRVGVREGYLEINRKAYAAIAAAYPTLAGECQCQFEAKLG